MYKISSQLHHFYTCLLLNSGDIVETSHNLCEPALMESLPLICLGSSDVMLNSLANIGEGIFSIEIPYSLLNINVYNSGGCVHFTSELQHNDHMLQHYKPIIQDLKIDYEDGISGSDVLSLTFDRK